MTGKGASLIALVGLLLHKMGALFPFVTDARGTDKQPYIIGLTYSFPKLSIL